MFHIRLFGGLELLAPRDRQIPLPGPTSRTLLAYLALQPGRLFRRDLVAGLLWSDRTDRAAQKTLRNGLWRLRCALADEPDGDLLFVDGCQIGLLEAAWIDVREFRNAVAGVSGGNEATLTAQQVQRLELARSLYRGDLLDGIYDEWTTGPREQLRLGHQTALENLLLHYRSIGDFRSAVDRGRELLHLNPYLEHVHRELMLCYWAIGDRPLAVRQFQICEEVLRRELDLEPMAETSELLARIRTGALPRGPDPWNARRAGRHRGAPVQ